MAKAKPAAQTDDGTITRDKTPPKASINATPKVDEIEQTRFFTAAFKSDAHAAADHWLDGREEINREESDAGDAGVKVTVTYKQKNIMRKIQVF